MMGYNIAGKQSIGILFAAALLLSAGSAYACPHGAERGNQSMGHLEQMADELKLDDQQRQQLKQLQRDRRSNAMALHDARQDNRDAMRKLDPGAADYQLQLDKLAHQQGELAQQMALFRGDMKQRVYALLTPEQRQQAKVLAEQRPHAGRGPGRDQRGPDSRRF